MKRIFQLFGRLIFRVGWPLWWVYFKLQPERTRVLVIADGRVLLVKGWLSDGRWALPGGGAKRNEDLLIAAVRELKEETGIDVPASSLRHLGDYRHTRLRLIYQAHYFALELDDHPVLVKRWPEIIESDWLKLTDIRGNMLDEDAAYALKQYIPQDQTQLL